MKKGSIENEKCQNRDKGASSLKHFSHERFIYVY